MIGLDTNVLLRFLLQDDIGQSSRSSALFDSLCPQNPGYISLVTLVELVWVFDRTYRKPRNEISAFLRGLLESKDLVIEKYDAVSQALRRFDSSSADFPDCLIERLCASAGCSQTMTFDVGAAKSAGMVLL
jgi:predicted nucleic-acid-binding protein